MFASQLLRILQTIPSDVKHETCVNDIAELYMIMKENQNDTLNGSKSFDKGFKPLMFESKEVYQMDGLGRDTHPSPFEIKGGVEGWNPFVDDLSLDNQKVTRDSSGGEFQNGVLHCQSDPEKSEHLLSSIPSATDKAQSITEHERSVAGEDFVDCDKNEYRDSRPPCITASDLFEKDNNLFGDNFFLECKPPDSIVCYKEINYHVVKDMCMDEMMPVHTEILDYNSKADQSDHSLSQPLYDNSHCKDIIKAVNKELLVSDGSAATSLENTKSTIANEHEIEEESHSILLSQGRPKLPENTSVKDIAKDCDHKDSVQKGETNFSSSRETNHASEESFVDSTLPIQEFGTRSFLRSFLNSLDGGELPDQKCTGKVVSEGCAPSSVETGPKQDVQASNLRYNSKVETGSITSNFNSPKPVLGGVANVATESTKEQSVPFKDSIGHKDTCSENAHDQTFVSTDDNPVIQLSSSHEVVSSHVSKHELRDPLNDAVGSLRRYDEGESSFINYSGPIAFSGSLSLGSDGSPTSGRSFAFPIIQPEWNSSPVRMTKTEGRHFRKHKGWRSGLLCCKF